MHDNRIFSLSRIFIATSNAGKITDFRAIANNLGVQIQALPGLEAFPQAVEDGITFDENARIKAEHYSRLAPGDVVVADDSGLAVDALNGAPGVHSARYAAVVNGGAGSPLNSDDDENNRLLITQLKKLQPTARSGKFVCVIAAARNGGTLQTFYGEVCGELLTVSRGNFGFGYDPLFYFPALGKTFAELAPEEKAKYSHRGKAFRKFLEWWQMEQHRIIGSPDHQVIGENGQR